MKEEKKISVSFFRLYRYCDKLDYLLLIIGSICAAAAGVGLPSLTLIVKRLIDVFTLYSLKKISTEKFLDEVNANAIYYVYLAVGIFVTTYTHIGIFTYIGEKQTHRLRETYFKSILRQNIAWFDDKGAGEIATRITNDTNLIQTGISDKVSLTIQDSATFIAGFVIALFNQWKIALSIVCIIPMIGITFGLVNKFSTEYSKKSLEYYSYGGTIAEESISGIRTVSALNQQIRMTDLYNRYLLIAQKFGIKKSMTFAIGLAVVYFIIFSSYGLAYFYGGILIDNKEVTSGDVVSVVVALLIGAFSLSSIAPNIQLINLARSAGAKIFEAIDRVPPIDSNRSDGQKLDIVNGKIELKNIKFCYPSRPDTQIFDGFSLLVKPGTTVALIGSSGSGKSTVIQLLERFYDYDEGEISIDDVNIKDLNIKWLRNQIGLVSQEPILFKGTIAYNVALGLVGTDLENESEEKKKEAIIEACKTANAHDFINALPEQYETKVGERGFLLSGGQKQRIAIARAIVKNPKILFLDEATSALDTQSEILVQGALDRAVEGRTTITIAHRLSTIKNANKIVVMDKGKIVETGNHDELIKLDGMYKKLSDLQKVNKDKKQKTGNDDKVELIEKTDGNFEVKKIDTKVSTKTFDSTKSVEEYKKLSFLSLLYKSAKINKPETALFIIGFIGAGVQGMVFPVYAILAGGLLQSFTKTGQELRDEVNFWALMYFIIAIICALATFTQLHSFGVSAEKLTTRLRLLSFKSILNQEIGWFDRDKNSTGFLTSLLASYPQDIQGLSGITLGTLLQNLVNLIGSIIVSFIYNWKLSAVIISTLPLIIVAGYLRIAMTKYFQARSKKSYSQSAQLACEAASSVKVVASLTLENKFINQYSDELLKPLKQGYKSSIYSSAVYAFARSLDFLVNALSFWYGAKLYSQGELELKTMFIVFLALVIGTSRVSESFAFIPDINKAKEAAQSIFYLLERNPLIDINDNEKTVQINKFNGNIKFENVVFRYPTRLDTNVLKGINFEVKPGQFVALVGPSGCGKSTTVSLIERFYDTYKGVVKIDDVDIKEYNLSELRQNMAIVSQEPTLYDMSIRENIVLGARDANNVTEEDIVNAAKQANIHEFISKLPDGYDTRIGSKGSQLSGGQKQRIAIARALIRNPSLLLLDEATSALDAESEKIVQKALDNAITGRTTISIAHRLSTIQKADVIFVFSNGNIVEQGSHQELLSKNGLYAEMVNNQSLDENDI